MQYVRNIEELPTFMAIKHNQNLGFLTIKQHNEFTAEIYVMAVRPEVHRKGVGRELVNKAEQLKEAGLEFLQVKTLGTSHPDKYYATTRAFYLTMGFRPIEEFTQIWGEQNPCLIMVKAL